MATPEYYAVRLPPVLLPLLRQWMSTNCGRDYEEPRAWRMDQECHVIWLDEERNAYESIALRNEFQEVATQRWLKPYAALTDDDMQAANQLIANPQTKASIDEIQRLTTALRFSDAPAFRQARTGTPGSEQDFGVIHRETDTTAPEEQEDAWTVTVINETGDVYAECRRTGEVILLGKVVADDGYADAEQRFKNWEYALGGRTLSWFADRCKPLKND